MTLLRSLSAVVMLASACPLLGAEPAPQQYLATVRITENQPGGEPKVLAAPRVIFTAEGPAIIEVGDDKRKCEISLSVAAEAAPITHLVKVKIIQDPNSKTPAVLASSTLALAGGKPGKISSDRLVIEAAVETLPEPAK
ncbi:hypothetical protein ETAA8_35220 [Anatilimnocola aggregata]|uniref:Uncharacterized protein n=1 Tax=Anatilimnocola aggregata TaxID=2528021 RepID=A0A517YE42_9BACT|nr:hypothetical protein [Anatilimnocola aggregata]QDU28422.1 hypothetical protein ETAA8_35220 [Anatilimnocola aggregata]